MRSLGKMETANCAGSASKKAERKDSYPARFIEVSLSEGPSSWFPLSCRSPTESVQSARCQLCIGRCSAHRAACGLPLASASSLRPGKPVQAYTSDRRAWSSGLPAAFTSRRSRRGAIIAAAHRHAGSSESTEIETRRTASRRSERRAFGYRPGRHGVVR